MIFPWFRGSPVLCVDRSGLAPTFGSGDSRGGSDRRLWYALHSLGMPNPYVEARGSRDHYAAECLTGEPIHAPSIDRAALGLQAEAAGMQSPSSPGSEAYPAL